LKKTILLLAIFLIFAVVVSGTENTLQTLIYAGLTAIFVRLIIEGVD